MSVCGVIADRSSAVAWSDTRAARFDGSEYGEVMKLCLDSRFPSVLVSRGLSSLGMTMKFYCAARPWSLGAQVARFPQLARECSRKCRSLMWGAYYLMMAKAAVDAAVEAVQNEERDHA